MKKQLAFALLLISLVSSSCSKSEPSPSNLNTSVGSGISWTIDSRSYSEGARSAVIQDSIGVLVISTVLDTKNGVYSGSALTFTFHYLGDGDYTLTSLAAMDTQVDTGSGALISRDKTEKLIAIACMQGTATTKTVVYDSPKLSTSVVRVTTDKQGKPNISFQPLVLSLSKVVPKGIEDAPDQITLSLK